MSLQQSRRDPLSRNRNRGLTFIELMITLIVAAILLTIGVPAVREFVVNNQTTAQTNQFLADLALARTQSITLARSVRVSAVGARWEDGWVVASDRDMNGTIDGAGDAADAALRQQGASPEEFQLTMTDAGGTTLTSLWVDRLGTGVQDLPNGTSIQFPVRFSIETPDRDSSRARSICVAASGVAISRKGMVTC